MNTNERTGEIAAAGRRHDLDFVRVAAFGLLIIFHTGLVFGTDVFLIKADVTDGMFDFVSLALHPWRMSLLFMLSGMVTAELLLRRSPRAVRSLRSMQLIPAFLFGIFVLIPPQAYAAASTRFGLTNSYLEFWENYLAFGTFTAADGTEIPLLSMQHLWFLAYLWIYTAILTTLAEFPVFTAAFRDWIAGFLRGPRLLLWPVLYLAVLLLTVGPIFENASGVLDDGHAHIVYFSFFAVGFALMRSEAFWKEAIERRHLSLGVAVGCFSLLAVFDPDVTAAPGLISTLLAVARSGFQWCAILAILGYAHLNIRRQNAVVTYLNKGVLTYYVLHQTVIVVLALWLKNTVGLIPSQFWAIVFVTCVVCLVAYEVWRRFSWIWTPGRKSIV